MENLENGLTAEMVTEQMLKDTFGVKEVGQILRTYNYNLFRFLTSNRDISLKNKNKLISSLSQKNIFGASTILVKQHEDGYYYIYEGQHRFESLVKLSQPIDFIVNNNLVVDDISLMNTASEVWVLKDFLKKYTNEESEKDYQSYHRLKKLIDSYGSNCEDESVRVLTFSDILFIATGWTSKVTKDFKNGTLNISENDYNNTVIKCELLKQFMKEDTLPLNINVRRYVRSILSLIESIDGWSDRDTEILLKHINLYRSDIDYKNYGNDETYKELLVDVYNKSQKKRLIGKTVIGKKTKYFIHND